jgi:mono/diheme cytochrome c family protein
MRRNRSVLARPSHLLLLITSLLLVPLAEGCGNDPATANAGVLKIITPQIFSAADGTHTFKVPLLVPSVFGVTWSVSDPMRAEIEAYQDDPAAAGAQAMVIAKNPGTVKIRARAGGVVGEATLEITAATPQLWEEGRARYHEGRRIRNDIPEPTAACSNCHGMGGIAVEHTPAQIGGFSDQEVVAIFTEGKKPPGIMNRTVPFEQWSPVHRWQMTDEEKRAVVVYLRSLEPQSVGTSDFGGRGVFRGSRTGGTRGDGGGTRGDGGGTSGDAGM